MPAVHARHEIDAHLARWTAERDDRSAMALLQARGVPSGYVMHISDTVTDAQFLARGYPLEIDQPGLGPMLFEGSAFRSEALPAPITTPAPLLGEHTRILAGQRLGLAPEEIDRLLADGVLFQAAPLA